MDALTSELYAEPPPRPLNDAEHAVLRLIAIGSTYQEAGNTLLLGADSVKYHAVRLYRKLGARNAAHAVHIGWLRGLLGPSTAPSTPVHKEEVRGG